MPIPVETPRIPNPADILTARYLNQPGLHASLPDHALWLRDAISGRPKAPPVEIHGFQGRTIYANGGDFLSPGIRSASNPVIRESSSGQNSAQNPWTLLETTPMIIGAGLGTAFDKKNRFRGALLGGMAGGLAACAVSPSVRTTEVAPVQATESALAAQKTSVENVLKPWVGQSFGSYTIEDLKSADYISNTKYILQETDASTGAHLGGGATIAGLDVVDRARQTQHEQFLVFFGQDQMANAAYHIEYQQAPTSLLGVWSPATLKDASGHKVADVTFNADLTQPDKPFATLLFTTPTAVPATPPGTLFQTANLTFPDGTTTEQKQNILDAIAQLTLTGNVEAAALATDVAPTALPNQVSTETPTAVPKATENPLAGAPEGATGKNSNGEWIKPDSLEAGVIDVYKNVVDPKSGEVLAQGWYKDSIVAPTYQGGMPMMDEKGFPASMALHVWCEEGLKCPSLQHLDNSNNIIPGISFSKFLDGVIIERVTGKKLRPGPSKTTIQPADIIQFDADLVANKIALPFTTAHGDKYEYKISPETSMNIYLVKEMPNPDFKRLFINTKTSGDADGNLNVAVFSSKPIDSMPHDEFMDLIFFSPVSVILSDDQSHASVLNNMANPEFENLIALSYKDINHNPYIRITP